MDGYVIINAGPAIVTEWLRGWVGHGGGAPNITKYEVVHPRGCEAGLVWVRLMCDADRSVPFNEGGQRPREVIRIELQALSEDSVQTTPRCYTVEAVDCLVQLLVDMANHWPEVKQLLVTLALGGLPAEEACLPQTAGQNEVRDRIEALLDEVSRAIEATSGAETPFWDERLSPEEQMERYCAMRDTNTESATLPKQYACASVLEHAAAMEKKCRERAGEGAFAPPLHAPGRADARGGFGDAHQNVVERCEEQPHDSDNHVRDGPQSSLADPAVHTGGTPGEAVRAMAVDEELLQRLAERAAWWVATYPPCPPDLAKLYRWDLPPLLGVEDEEGGGLGAPDWMTVERLLKSKTELFFHWEDNVVVCRAGECPVLDEVSKIVRLPGISGEIYEKCHEVLSQPTGFEAHWVFRHYPILTQKIVWTLIFYAILREGLRQHYREDQRRRRDKGVGLDRLVTTGDAEVSLHETATTPVLSQPDDEEADVPNLDGLFEPLSKREREVAGLLAEGHQQTSIAELLGLTPGRISQLVSQLRRKSRIDPTRS